MGKTIRFDISKSLAMNFAIFENDLKNIAENHGIPVTEAIDQFVTDLKNYYEDGYTKNIEEITLGGITPKILEGLISYMNKMKKTYAKKEQQEKRRRDKEEKREVNKSNKRELEDRINDLVSQQKAETELDAMKTILNNINTGSYVFETSKEKRKIVRELVRRISLEDDKAKRIAEEKAEEEAKTKAAEEARRLVIQRKVEETWQGIQEVAEKGYKASGISESAYWIAIKRKFVEESSSLDNEEVKNQILDMFEETIIEKEDEEYFEEVKNVTRGFKYLGFYSAEIMNGMFGNSTRKLSSKNMDRFLNLRAELQKTANEYTQIRRLLNEKTTTQGDRKILLARKQVIDKEFEKRRRESGR
jgi:hypothetical protein